LPVNIKKILSVKKFLIIGKYNFFGDPKIFLKISPQLTAGRLLLHSQYSWSGLQPESIYLSIGRYRDSIKIKLWTELSERIASKSWKMFLIFFVLFFWVQNCGANRKILTEVTDETGPWDNALSSLVISLLNKLKYFISNDSVFFFSFSDSRSAVWQLISTTRFVVIPVTLIYEGILN